MSTLHEEHCVACRPGAPTVSGAALEALLEEVPGWGVVVRDGVPRLQREFTFPDFAAALAFTNRVGEEAEREDHHPALLTEWGKVTVGWWTHAVGGVHRNDFVMAALTSALYQTSG